MTAAPVQKTHARIGHFPRWLRRLLIGIIVVAAFIALLPPAVKIGLERLLREQGLESVAIDDVNLNLFTLTFELYGLRAARDRQTVLVIDALQLRLSWQALWDKRVQLETLLLGGAELRMVQRDDATWQVAGLALPAGQQVAATAALQEADEPWGLGIQELRISDSTLDVILPQLTSRLHLADVRLTDLYSWQPEQGTRLAFAGAYDDAALVLEGEVMPLATPLRANVQLNLDRLDLARYAPLLPERLHSLAARLSIDSRFMLELDAHRQGIIQQGTIVLDGFSFAYAPWQLESALIRWEGASSLGMQSGAIASLTLNGQSSVEKLVVTDAIRDQILLTLTEVKFDGVKLEGLNDIALATLALDGLQLNLQRDADGNLRLPRAEAPAEQAGVEDSVPLAFTVDTMRLAGDSRINIEDRALPSIFRQTVDIRMAEITGLDNRQPDKAAVFKFSAELDRFTTLEASGEVKPFTEKLNLVAHTEIKSLNLPQLTPYSMRYLGYNLTSGHLQAKVDVTIQDDTFRGRSKLHINKLNIEPSDPDKMQRFNDQLKIPLGTALYMLRDKRGNIALELPMEGNLRDPKFDISDAVNTALAKAMKIATMSYLKLLLQPYGTLVALKDVADGAGVIRLQAVKFADASAALQPEQIAYIDKIAAMLKERDKLQLRICGIAAANDRPKPIEGRPPLAEEAIAEALTDLAQQRAIRVKEYLVSQHGLKAEQLYICLPAIDKLSSAPPRVELLL